MIDWGVAILLIAIALGAGWRATAGWWVGRIPVAVFLGHAVAGLGAYAGAFIGQSVAGAAVGTVLLAAAGPRRRVEVPEPDEPFVTAAVVTATVLGALLLAMAFLRRPEGWDTIAIWLTKARAIAVNGSYDHAAFWPGVYVYSHPDYPTFLPAFQSLVFSMSPGPYGSGPVLLLTSLNVTGMLTALAISTRGVLLGVSAVVAFIASPAVLERIPIGYADLPAALLVLAGVLLLRRDDEPVWPACVLLAAGALTRSETIVHIGIVIGLTLAFSKDLRRRALLAVGTVLSAATPWWLLTASRGLSNDTLTPSALRPSRVARVAPERLGDSAAAVLQQMTRADAWGLVVLICVVIVLTHRTDRGLTVAALGSFGTLVAIYTLTQVDAAWQIATTVDRITLTPTALLVVAAADAAARETRPWLQRLRDSTIGRAFLERTTLADGGSSRTEMAGPGALLFHTGVSDVRTEASSDPS